MNPVLKGKGVMVSQGFYRKDSDSKRQVLPNPETRFSIWSVHTPPVDLSLDLSVVHSLDSPVGL